VSAQRWAEDKIRKTSNRQYFMLNTNYSWGTLRVALMAGIGVIESQLFQTNILTSFVAKRLQ